MTDLRTYLNFLRLPKDSVESFALSCHTAEVIISRMCFGGNLLSQAVSTGPSIKNVALSGYLDKNTINKDNDTSRTLCPKIRHLFSNVQFLGCMH